MDFREATAHLNALGVSYQEQAEALGIAYQTFRTMRMDSTSSPASVRKPPPADKWKPALAVLAETRATTLMAFSADMVSRSRDRASGAINPLA
jgi:hypothetical protein